MSTAPAPVWGASRSPPPQGGAAARWFEEGGLYRWWLRVGALEARSSRIKASGGLPRTGWGEGNRIHIHNQLGARARIKFARGAKCGQGGGVLALAFRSCGSRWACRPAGGRTARERLRAGAFGDSRAAGVLAAMLVPGPAKCYAGWFGHCVQAACSQGVCAGRSCLRMRQEHCGHVIC